MEPLSAFLGVVVLVVTVWLYGRRNYDYWTRRGVYNKRPTLPFFGNVKPNLILFKSILDVVQDLYNDVSGVPYAGIFFFTSPVLIVRDPEIIKDILITNFNYFVDRGFHVNMDKDLLSNNLIHSEGKNWKFARSKLQGSFTNNKLKSMTLEMDDLAKEVLERIEKDNENSRGAASFDASDLCERYTIDVFSACALGLQSNAVRNHEKSEFYAVSKDIFGGYCFLVHVFFAYFFPKLHALIGLRMTRGHVTRFFVELTQKILALKKETKRACENTTEEINGDHTNKGMFVDELIRIMDNSERRGIKENQQEENFMFDDKFVAGNIFMVYSAGFDASGKVATFSLFELAHNETIQNKAREEILTVLSENNDKLTLEAIQKMKYLEQIVSETNRKYTVLSSIFRRCVKRYEMPDGGVIEPGVPVLIPSSAIHRDPNFYPNPHVFDPERFNEEVKQCIHPSTYLPFGAGPRHCIAPKFAIVEIKVLLARILSTYRITLHPASSEYPVKLSPKAFLIRPENNIRISIKKLQ